MESMPALSGLTTLVTSNVTNVQGFSNDEQKMMLHIAILSLVCLFSCSVSASILQSNTNQKAGIRCFQGMITIFSALSVAMLSACMLPDYFKWFSYFFCSIPVIVHTISDKRWFRDWFPKPRRMLPLYHQSRPRIKWFPWTSSKKDGVVSYEKPTHIREVVEPIPAINIPVPLT